MPGGFPEKLAMMRRHGSGRGGPISEAVIVTLGHGCFPMSLRRLVSDGEMSIALSTCVNSALKRLSQTGMYWGPGLYLVLNHSVTLCLSVSLTLRLSITLLLCLYLSLPLEVYVKKKQT